MPDDSDVTPARRLAQKVLPWVGISCGLISISLSLGQRSEWVRSLFSGGPPATHSSSRVELEAAGWRFPAWDQDESLLEVVDVFFQSGGHGPSGATFLEDGAGGGELLLSYPGEWCRYDEHGEKVGERDVAGWGGEVERFEDADGVEYVLELRGAYSFTDDAQVVCRRGDEVLWRRHSESHGWTDVGAVRFADGRALVLLHDHDGCSARTPEGERVQEFRGCGTSYGHRTHPELPGVFLSYFGDATWHSSVHGSRIDPELDSSGGFVYVTAAEVFPGSSGERLALLSGPGREETGSIMVADEAGEPRWRASAPTKRLELARLDVEDGPPLFVVAADTGDLFVIDAEGTVLHHRTLPQEPREGIGVAIYELDAGPLGPDHIGIAVTLLDWIAVYRMAR